MILLEAFVYPRQSPFLIPMNMYNVEIQAINNNKTKICAIEKEDSLRIDIYLVFKK